MTDIHLDPITKKELDDAATESFNSVVKEMDGDFGQMSYQQVAELFFFNGYLRGCLAMSDRGNDGLKETIHMLKQEIAYQTNH